MHGVHERSPRLLAVVALATLLTSCQTTPGSPSDEEGPTLAVLLVVDQLTPDLLERYDGLFTGGLRRLRDEGYSFTNATHDHANTYTAPGHVTLATGVHPARHGVVGNEWSVREDDDSWRSVYAVEDLDRSVLGYPDLPGRGPANIGRGGLANWIAARDPEARIVSVSGKDRAAIGMAATAPGDVYWLERYGGQFVTSDHYRSELPSWVRDFNRDELPALYGDSLWESGVPESARSMSRPDSSAFELYGGNSTFPHRPSDRVDPADPSEVNYWRWTFTPFPDAAVAALAIRAVRELELGGRGHLDFLGLSLSQVDLVGHYYGPGSREQLDNLLRLDRSLGRVLDALDEEVGPGRWVLAFSADHGVLEIPEELALRGEEAGRLTRGDRADLLATLEGAEMVAPGDRAAVRDAVLELPFVEATYTFEEIERGPAADSFVVLYRNSHSTSRIAHVESRSGIYARLTPNTLRWGSPAATHGSPYLYDRHVPLIFLGTGVPAGSSTDRVATVDAAPTLARLAGVEPPGDLDGRVLEAALPR